MKKNVACTLLIPILVLLSTGAWSVAYASTYHVRTDGSDTSCNGTANSSSASATNCAFRTMQKGINTAQAGDIVQAHAGNYSGETLSTARSGTSASPITLEEAPGETATIGPIKISHNYITVQNFDMTRLTGNGSNGMIYITGSYNQILGNYIYSNSSGDYNNGSARAIGLRGSNNLVDSNIFDGKSTTATGVQPTIYIVIDIGGSGQKITNNTIKNMIDCERVFEINGGNNVLISRNDVSNIWGWDYNVAHVDIFQSWVSPGPQNYIVEKNYFHDMPGGVQIGVLGTGGIGPFIIRNNTFANISSSLFMGMKNVTIVNNTFYRTAYLQSSLIFANDGTDISTFTMENNIFYDTAVGNGVYGGISSPGTKIIDYNYAASAANGTKSGFREAHGVNGGDPKFMAAYSDCIKNSCNFMIASDSAARDKGATLTQVPDDYVGNSRVAPYDIGSYEFSSSTTIVPPNNLRVNQ